MSLEQYPIWLDRILLHFLLFARDLCANAFRVCRIAKPVSTLADHALPFRQFEFDPAVALVGFLRVAGIERLELAKAGRCQAVGRYTQ